MDDVLAMGIFDRVSTCYDTIYMSSIQQPSFQPPSPTMMHP